jgi:hypothetical protein
MKGSKVRLSVILAALLIAGMASETVAMPPHWHKPCMQAWKDYKKKPRHKAFAMSPVRTAMMVYCGTAWRAGSKAQAEKEAMRYCASKSKSTVCYVTDSE